MSKRGPAKKDDRFKQARRAQRRRSWLRVLLGLLGVAAVGGLVWLVWFSSVLGVSSVKVEGTETIEPADVRAAADITRGSPLARLDTSEIQARVASLERVERVEVERSWPRTVVIRVLERTAVAWMRDGPEIRGIDRHGVDFRSYSREPSLVEIRVSTTDPRRRQQALEGLGQVIVVLQENDPALLDEIDHLSAESTDSIELQLSEGRTVTWGSADSSEEKLTVLKALLDSVEARGYDVSAPDQPTTRS